jgi:type IV pilus assembly protein PilW
VEIMIGLVLGMLGIIVIMQVFTIVEAQKRTTTGSGDAQSGGAIALYSMQRDIQQAGDGISTLGLIGCDVELRSGVALPAMAPVTVNHASIPAGDANTDTLLVVYGSSNSPPEGNSITSQTGSNYAVQAYASFSIGDLVIAEPAARPVPCSGANSLILTPVTAVGNPNVTVQTSAAGMTGGTLYTLGPAPVVRAYAIRGGNLTVCDYTANDCSQAANTGNAAVWQPIANNIVSLRVQYGRDTNAIPMNGIVDTYDQTTPTTACGWVRISTLRLVLVARNDQPSRKVVTTNVPSWSGTTANNPNGFTSTAAAVNLSSTTVPANFTWQNYRYKVFETTVPIQNVELLGVQAGC